MVANMLLEPVSYQLSIWRPQAYRLGHGVAPETSTEKLLGVSKRRVLD